MRRNWRRGPSRKGPWPARAHVGHGRAQALDDVAPAWGAAGKEFACHGRSVRGAIALRFDRVDEAESHFRTGLKWALKPVVRFDVGAGRCLQGLADVAERRGDLETAHEHLDAAGALFAKHGAKLYLDQVLAKKSVLGA